MQAPPAPGVVDGGIPALRQALGKLFAGTCPDVLCRDDRDPRLRRRGNGVVAPGAPLQHRGFVEQSAFCEAREAERAGVNQVGMAVQDQIRDDLACGG